MENDIPTISVADPGCLSRILGSRVEKIPGSGSASKNLIILTQKIVSKLSEICFPVCSSRIPDRVKKAPDPGSGSATLRYLVWSEL